MMLEKVERRALKFILGDSRSEYKERHIDIQLIPLMMIFELNDIIFFVSLVKFPSSHFNVLDHISFNSVKSSSHISSSIHHQTVTQPGIISSKGYLNYGMHSQRMT